MTDPCLQADYKVCNYFCHKCPFEALFLDLSQSVQRHILAGRLSHKLQCSVATNNCNRNRRKIATSGKLQATVVELRILHFKPFKRKLRHTVLCTLQSHSQFCS